LFSYGLEYIHLKCAGKSNDGPKYQYKLIEEFVESWNISNVPSITNRHQQKSIISLIISATIRLPFGKRGSQPLINCITNINRKTKTVIKKITLLHQTYSHKHAVEAKVNSLRGGVPIVTKPGISIFPIAQ
jgi:hypothetical protein